MASAQPQQRPVCVGQFEASIIREHSGNMLSYNYETVFVQLDIKVTSTSLCPEWLQSQAQQILKKNTTNFFILPAFLLKTDFHKDFPRHERQFSLISSQLFSCSPSPAVMREGEVNNSVEMEEQLVICIQKAPCLLFICAHGTGSCGAK